MISLISDFDGTLFFHREQPPVRIQDVKKIQEFQKNNIFGLCTGRPLSGISDLKKYNLQCDFYILTSGALIVDRNFDILYEKCMDTAVVQEILNDTQNYRVVIQAKSKIYPVKETVPIPVEQEVVDKASDIAEPILGISVEAKDEKEANTIVRQLKANYEIQALQNGNFIDIVSVGCSKGTAVRYIKSHCDLNYIAAIGDSYNDIDMLEQADLAFTFSTSPQSVKKEANYLVSGISQAIDIMEQSGKVEWRN